LPTKAKGKTGVRYSNAEKKKVVDFVRANGRGGISAAMKKYSVSYVAVRRWLDGPDSSDASRVRTRGAAVRKVARVAERLSRELANLKAAISRL
jgi:hypothetical protein